jgi:hypothetical protein
MPTDVSTPNWRCDVCKSTFREDKEAAERCEHSPVPEPLPEGAMILTFSHRFSVLRVTRVQGPNRADHGAHTWMYQIGGSHDSNKVSSAIWPHDPDRLNIVGRSLHANRYGGFYNNNRDDQFYDLLRRLGMLDADSSPPWSRGVGRHEQVLGPISPRFRRLIELFDIRFERPSEARHRSSGHSGGGEDLLLMESGFNVSRARVQALIQDPQQVNLRLERLWDRWWAGEQVQVPVPRLRATREIFPSKATKAMKAVLAELDVQWPARTECSYVAKEVMMEQVERVDVDTTLFPVPIAAVVGGKGGTGKTTVASALALRMAHNGLRVLLLDLDMENPNQAALWGVGAPPVDRERGLMVPEQVAANLAVLSVGSLLEPGESPGWEAGTWRSWIEFVSGAVDWSAYDQVVLDMGPGFTPAHDRMLEYPGSVDVWVHVSNGTALGQDGCSRLISRIDRHQFNRHPATQLLVYNPAAGGTPGSIAPLPGDVVPQIADIELPRQPDPRQLCADADMGKLADLVRTSAVASHAKRLALAAD